jgi:hypothetical protein
MIIKADEMPEAKSFGLIESIGLGKTKVDQSDGDDDYYDECAEVCANWSLECFLYVPGQTGTERGEHENNRS